MFINLGASGAEATHAFGHYWFQLRSINFIPNVGFALEVVVVRQFVTTDSESCWKCQARAKESDNAPPVKIDSIGAALLDMRSRLVLIIKFLSRGINFDAQTIPSIG